MRRKVLDAGTLRGRFHHVPDRLGRDSIARNLTQPTYSPEDRPAVDAGRRDPLIDGAFRPHWNGNGADVLSFANKVGDYPHGPGNPPFRVQPVRPVAGRIQ